MIPSDNFTIPLIGNPMPACPRRLLNERLYLKNIADAPEMPMIGARRLRMRYQEEQTILVNDAGMVRSPLARGLQS